MATKKLPSIQTKYARGLHPNSRKNLRNGNFDDFNRDYSGFKLTKALKLALMAGGKQKAQELIKSTIEGALLREPTPFKEVWDRVEGRIQDDKPQYNDNRQYNIIIQGEENKAKLQQLLSGEKPIPIHLDKNRDEVTR